MNQFLDNIPTLPVSDAVEYVMEILTDSLASLFDFVQKWGQNSMDSITDMLLAIPAIIFILIVAIIAFFASKKKFGLAIFSIVGLYFIY
ncbi:glycine/betaine ABC transporter, partial [Butyricicoccus sp. 1XD8-22]